MRAVLFSDSDVRDAGRVIRLETMVHTPGAPKGWLPDSAMVFQEHWAKAGAPVESASRYFSSEMSVRTGSRLQMQQVSFVDPALVQVFSLRAVAGDLADTLSRPDKVVLSEKTALRLFGGGNSLGKTFQLAGKTVTVGAVVPDRPRGSAISSEMLVNITSPIMPEEFRLTSWVSLRGTNFVRLLSGATPELLAERAQTYFEQTPAFKEIEPRYGKIATFRAVTLLDLPLAGAESDATRRLAAGLGLSCIIVTLLAAINFVNLTTVRILGRQSEIGIRKALGASPGRIAAMFISESVLVALIACAIGILTAWVAAPFVSEWIDRPLAGQTLSLGTLVITAVCGIGLGLITGAYPAWLASAVRAAHSIAGREQAETATGLWVRRGLTVLQFGAAIALVGTTVVALWQARYVSRVDPGYDPTPLLIIDAPVDLRDTRLLALRDAISRLQGVEAVGLSWDVPGRFNRNTTADFGTSKGETVLLAFNYVGPGFFQSYGVAPVSGRVFDPERDLQGNREALVINSSAARQLGFANANDAIGQRVRMGNRTVELIGVVPDIRQRSLRDKSGGVVYSIESLRFVSVMSVRSADPAKTQSAITETWQRFFPDDVLKIETARVHLARLYEADMRLGKLAAVGGIIALCLAGFGLYALSAHTVRRRMREIALRKLHGARRRHIAKLLTQEFLGLLAVGALIGLPLAAWASESYLSGFVARAPIGPWALTLALGAAILVALSAAVRNTVRGMQISPAQAFRL